MAGSSRIFARIRSLLALLNPRKPVLPLVDMYLAAVRCGEGDAPLFRAAADTIAEVMARATRELESLPLTAQLVHA